MKTVSEANISEHWAIRKKRHDVQKRRIKMQFLIERPVITLPCIVKLTRLSPRMLDDDNLRMAFKAIRDAIADKIRPGLAPGRADNSGIQWEYYQEKTKGQKIRIEIIPKEKND